MKCNLQAMEAKYKEWCENYITQNNGVVFGKCREATKNIIKEFPELKEIAGHVYCCWGKRSHFWCLSPDKEIVDPTRNQFPGPVEYEAWEPGQEILVGKCMDCGEEIWMRVESLNEIPTNPNAPFCSESCGKNYRKYLEDGVL